MPRTYRSVEERFWAKVDKTDACWLWTAATTRGYGQFGFEGRVQLAHRVAWTLLVGPIPDGLTIDHLCKVKHCVNPAHLEPVTIRENIVRADGTGGMNARKTHCPLGHAYDEENTYRKSNGGRECRACRRLRRPPPKGRAPRKPWERQRKRRSDATVSSEQIGEALKRRAQGESVRSIARSFGVTHTALNNALR